MKNICCPFCGVPKHDRSNGICRRMHAFYSMTFHCWRTRQNRYPARKSCDAYVYPESLNFSLACYAVKKCVILSCFMFLFPSSYKEKWIRHTRRSKLYLFSRNVLHSCETTSFMDVTVSRMSVWIEFWYVVTSWLMRSWNILICERERGSTLPTAWLMHLYIERIKMAWNSESTTYCSRYLNSYFFYS